MFKYGTFTAIFTIETIIISMLAPKQDFGFYFITMSYPYDTFNIFARYFSSSQFLYIVIQKASFLFSTLKAKLNLNE